MPSLLVWTDSICLDEPVKLIFCHHDCYLIDCFVKEPKETNTFEEMRNQIAYNNELIVNVRIMIFLMKIERRGGHRN